MSFAALYLLTTVAGDAVHDADVRQAMWTLMERTRYGFAETEEAMFIVRSDGRYRCMRWAPTQLPHQARWTGPIPHGVVAIVHTHPNWEPRPSRTDARTARRTRIAVYVVTRTRIVKTDGEEVSTVVSGDWKP